MANQQINQYLYEQTTPDDGDWYDIDAYNGGNFLSKKISWATIKNSIIQASPNIYKADGILTGDRDVNLDSNFLRFRNGVTMFGGAGNSALSAVSLSKKNTGVNEYLRAWDDSNSSFWQIGSDQRFTYRTASGGFIAFGDETNGGTQLNNKWLSLHGDVALRSGKTFNYGDDYQISNNSNFLGYGIDALTLNNESGNSEFLNFLEFGDNSVIVSKRPDSNSSQTKNTTGLVFDSTYWNGASSDRKQAYIYSGYNDTVFNEFVIGFNFSDDYGVTTDSITTSLLIMSNANLSANTTAIGITFNNGTSNVIRRVEVGAADSAGTGYRALRIVN